MRNTNLFAFAELDAIWSQVCELLAEEPPPRGQAAEKVKRARGW